MFYYIFTICIISFISGSTNNYFNNMVFNNNLITYMQSVNKFFMATLNSTL